MTPEFLEALLDRDRDRAADALAVELPDRFPPEDAMRFFALRLRQMREDERFLEWCPHAVVLEGRMIGHAGYHGPPGINAKQSPGRDRDRVHDRGGLSRQRLRDRGRRRATANGGGARGAAFVACTSPDNEPSLAIIRRLGFRQTGEAMDEEDGLELVFELER